MPRTESFVFEITGASDKIEQFIALMLPLGLVEVSRTGIAAIARGAGGDVRRCETIWRCHRYRLRDGQSRSCPNNVMLTLPIRRQLRNGVARAAI